MIALHRIGLCSRCGVGWGKTTYFIWASATLAGWLCKRCELWTKEERKEERKIV